MHIFHVYQDEDEMTMICRWMGRGDCRRRYEISDDYNGKGPVVNRTPPSYLVSWASFRYLFARPLHDGVYQGRFLPGSSLCFSVAPLRLPTFLFLLS